MEQKGLLLPDHLGTTIPNTFANVYGYPANFLNWDEIKEAIEYLKIAQSDAEEYWDTWAYVLDNARIDSKSGVPCRLEQDGDVWLVPENYVEEEEEEEEEN